MIWPEAIILGGAAILGFLVSAIKPPERWKLLASVFVGVIVALLFYAAGLVAGDELTKLQAGARAVLAGILMAMAGSQAPATLRALTRGDSDG